MLPVPLQLGDQVTGADIPDARDLLRIRPHGIAQPAQEDVTQFMFRAEIPEAGVVLELVHELEGCGCVQFITQTPPCGNFQRLATARVAAAGIGPVACPQPLRVRALLQE